MLTINKEAAIFAMSKDNKPVAKVDPGTSVIFETHDAFFNNIKTEDQKLESLDWDYVNPATGPLYINGASPGDVLEVKIEKIEIATKGIGITILGMGPLGNNIDKTVIKMMDIDGDHILFNNEIKIPVSKMIGVIGTAPEGEAVNCGTPDYHGGNMDCKEIKEGATLFLPVCVEGGLLALGDLHAAMADGEVGISGVEVSGKVTVTVNLIKNSNLPTPMIINDTHIMTIASHEDLDIACDMAIQNMWKYITTHHSIEKNEAAILLSLVGETKICQVVDPKKTIRVEINKALLK